MPRLLRQQLLLLLLVMTSIYGRFDRGPRPRGGLLLVLVPILLGHRGLLGADAQATAPVLLDVRRDGLLDGANVPVAVGVVRVAAVAVLAAVRVRLLAMRELPLPVAVDEIHQVVVPLRLLHERMPRELPRGWPLKKERGEMK